MTTRISGLPRQGLWFSADIITMRIEVVGGDFINDVNGENPAQSSALENILRVVSQYGTVIGMSVESATVVHIIADYAQKFEGLQATLEKMINDIDLSNEQLAGPNLSEANVTVYDGFRGGNNA